MAGPVAFLAPDPLQSTQLIPGGNTPASGGLLFVYQVGSTTKTNSYTDPSASTARTNPIVLDSGGNVPGNGEVWITSTAKFVLAPFNDTDPPSSPYWSKDNYPGINNITAAQVQSLSAQSEWVQGSTVTFVGVTAFSLVGDQTPLYTLGRRVKATVTGGDRFGIVTSAVLATGSTAVGVTLDSGTLNGGLSVVSYGILSTPNGSIPWTNITSTGVQNVSTGTLFATGAIVGSSSTVWGTGTPTYGLLTKRKVIDETVTTSTALQNDDDLFFPIAPNEEWLAEFYVNFGNLLSITGLTVSVSSVVGTTSSVFALLTGNNTTSFIPFSNAGFSDGAFVNLTSTNLAAIGTANLYMNYRIVNSTTSGNARLRWAPLSNTSSPLTAFHGSYLKATRIA